MLLSAGITSFWATARLESIRWVKITSVLVGALLAAGWALASGVDDRWYLDGVAVIWQMLACVCWAGLIGLMSTLAVVDSATYRLPNKLMWPSYVIYMLSLCFSWLAGDREYISTSLSAACCSGVLFALMAALSPEGLGWGDVKYVVPLAGSVGWWGWPALGQAALLMAITGGVVAIVVFITTRNRRASIPFGPIMLIGAILGIGLISIAGP